MPDRDWMLTILAYAAALACLYSALLAQADPGARFRMEVSRVEAAHITDPPANLAGVALAGATVSLECLVETEAAQFTASSVIAMPSKGDSRPLVATFITEGEDEVTGAFLGGGQLIIGATVRLGRRKYHCSGGGGGALTIVGAGVK